MAVARRSGVQGFAPDAAAVAGKGAPAPARRSFQVVPDASTEVVGERASNAGVLLFSAVVFAVSFCAVLGVAIQNISKFSGASMSFLKSLTYGTSAAIGFLVAIVLFAGVRERLESSDIPSFLKGMPIVLITAALLSIAFLGFSGLSFGA